MSRLGIRVLDVYSEYLGGKALADEKWEGDEGEGMITLLSAKTSRRNLLTDML